ncbi:MAG: methylenetetrahydrofolate reductase [Pseudomonadales bacterium]|nr:methylenetetrahydrofolate reductase [Pseudomonadales bacterium]MBO6597162.1 methylenetetrahydrofolate reductase [Pseudomonadales bacterium]MBO6823651.1 methylenetetrahydrofolate reductase [Pseudomonadales bacterium]
MKRLLESLSSEELSITAELPLNGIQGVEDLRHCVAPLESLVHALHVSDTTGLTALAVSKLLLDANIDPVMQITAAGRSMREIEIDIQAALSMGINSLLLMKGNTALPGTVSARDMLSLTNQICQEERKRYLAGTIARVFKPMATWEPASLIEKTNAGATFIKTELCLNPDMLSAYMSHLVRAKIIWRAPVIATIGILTSLEQAMWVKKHVQGAVIPETVLRRLETAQDPEKEGIRIALETMETFSEIPGVAGICIQTPANALNIVDVIQQFLSNR